MHLKFCNRNFLKLIIICFNPEISKWPSVDFRKISKYKLPKDTRKNTWNIQSPVLYQSPAMYKTFEASHVNICEAISYLQFLLPFSNLHDSHKNLIVNFRPLRRVTSATVPGSWTPTNLPPRAFIPWRNDYSDRLQRYAFTPPYFCSNRLWSGNYSSAACAVSGKLWCKWRERGWGGVAARRICNIEQKRWIYWMLV